jgi:hypothetical protein
MFVKELIAFGLPQPRGLKWVGHTSAATDQGILSLFSGGESVMGGLAVCDERF